MSQVQVENYQDLQDEQDIYEGDDDTDEGVEVSPIVDSFIEHVNLVLDDDQTRVKQFGSKVSELFEDSQFKEQMSLFAEQAESSETFFVDEWTIVDWEIASTTLGSILEGSQFQEQYGVLSAAIQSLMLDKLTGLANNGFLFLYPLAEVIQREDGSTITIGGHHRITMACAMLAQGGTPWGTILDMEVPVMLGKIDRAKLAELNDVPLSKVTEYERELEARLWMASNRSRKPTAAETSDYNNNKKGIVLSDVDSILNNSILSTKDKVVNYFLSVGFSEGILPDKKTGSTERQLVAFPNATDDEMYWPDPKPQTFLSIASAFYTQLGKITIGGGEQKEGKKAKAVKKWEPSLKSAKHLTEIIDWIYTPDERTGLSPLEQAIPKGLAQAEGEYKSNVARNASKIGAALAIVLDSQVNPPVKPNAPKEKAKAKSAKGSKFKPRNVRA